MSHLRNVSPFARARNICCGQEKNACDFVQKHFVSATNVSQFAQLKKHHELQCVLVCKYLYGTSLLAVTIVNNFAVTCLCKN